MSEIVHVCIVAARAQKRVLLYLGNPEFSGYFSRRDRFGGLIDVISLEERKRRRRSAPFSLREKGWGGGRSPLRSLPKRLLQSTSLGMTRYGPSPGAARYPLPKGEGF
jgi:hypothetical protein